MAALRLISDIQSRWAASLKRTYVARAHRQFPKLKVECYHGQRGI